MNSIKIFICFIITMVVIFMVKVQFFVCSIVWAMMEIVHETVRDGESCRISVNGIPDLLCRISRNILHELSPLSLKGGCWPGRLRFSRCKATKTAKQDQIYYNLLVVANGLTWPASQLAISPGSSWIGQSWQPLVCQSNLLLNGTRKRGQKTLTSIATRDKGHNT